jgi:hypothetical protein
LTASLTAGCDEMADTRHADLNPPLGWPGGLCHIVERIQDEVKNPRLEGQLVEKVERGDSLTNPEAAQIYDMETEKGVTSTYTRLKIGPHAQYRMDLRGVTVGDIRVALRNFFRQMMAWKSQNAWQWKRYSEDMLAGDSVEWIDSKIGNLVVVFTGGGRDTLKIITAYWKGIQDPRGPSDKCRVRSANNPPSGFRTFVHEQHPTKSDTGDKRDTRYPERALPGAPDGRTQAPSSAPVYNGPGPSGTGPGGRTVHKDMVRTPGVPGKEHPVVDSRNTPVRRPGLSAASTNDSDEMLILSFFEEDLASRSAGMVGPPYPSANLRQKDQKGQAKAYDKARYRSERSDKIRAMRMRHKKLKTNTRYKADRIRRREHPEKFERKPSGGSSSVSQRSQNSRDKAKRSPMQQRQDQKWQKKGGLPLTPFLWLPTDEWGVVRDVSDLTEFVTALFPQGPVSMPLGTFLDGAFIEEGPFENFVAHLDDIFEFSGSSSEEENAEGDVPDPVLDAWLARTAELLYEQQRPARSDASQHYSPAQGHGDRLRLDRRPGEGMVPHEVEQSSGSGKVIPEGRDFENRADRALKRAVELRWSQLPEDKKQALRELVRTPLWRQYAQGLRDTQDVVRWWVDRGYAMTSHEWSRMLQMADMRLAARITDVQEGCNQDLLQKAQGLKVSLVRVDPRNRVWLFDVEGSEGPYRVRLKAIATGNVKTVAKADVKVSCSCPFWRWQGPEHWAQQKDYLYGAPVGTASQPVIKDPSGAHRACKHVLACFAWVLSHDWQIPAPTKRASFADPVDRVASRFLWGMPQEVLRG